MMDSLRTAANSLVLKIIFGIIIVSFILTGVSGYLIGGGNNYAAKVNDQEISRGQFENAFNSERNRMQQQLGDQYSELAANEGYMKTLRQQVLNRLIDEALLDQYARELNWVSAMSRLNRRFSRPQPSRLTANLITAAITVSSTRWG